MPTLLSVTEALPQVCVNAVMWGRRQWCQRLARIKRMPAGMGHRATEVTHS